MSQDETPSKPEYIVPTAGQRGMTALHHAAYLNDPDACRVELQHGIPVNVRDDGGWTPLHWSIDMAQAWGEPEQVVSLLLGAGASPNTADHSGFTVLMMACARNNETIFEQLLKAGANIHQRSDTTTPLHEAAACNFCEAIQRLLALGVDPNQTDSRGRTPEQVAEVCGFEGSVTVLKTARSAT
jgi:ankyrin repeat protein